MGNQAGNRARSLLIVATLLAIGNGSVSAATGEGGTASFADGRALAQAVYDSPSGQDASSKVVMLLERNGSTKQRLLYSYAKNKGNSERWTLLRFIKPNDVAKTGLLTMDYAGDASDQWLYLPALDRVRRIASSRKGGRFVGSDFYYEDLTDREIAMDHHTLIGQDSVGGASCLLLESIPVEKSNSVYSKRVSCIHPKILIPLRIDFYEKGRDKPGKRLQASKIRRIQNYWTVFDSTMYNLETGHNTKLITLDIRYDQNLPDDLFSQRGLSDDSRELPFRPNTQATHEKTDETQ
ncbi:MAG: outer membrane lipoprotein-sorting protein [Parahaliea sp.]